ncbi:FYVE zinc finger-domain-containing protein [Exophiala viscosa]|uniref:RING-type E3 ubiquitin transferase n=1 Tax=Exophiala viscosa TaxID=2486360 RepID=A0AAN6DN48_9EURO|nr:FYVE zinc finger-domain-containing protein [Exophiala viscosa]
MSSPELSDTSESTVNWTAATTTVHPADDRHGTNDDNEHALHVSTHRPLPNPLIRSRPSHSGGQVPAPILRDRPLPRPSLDQTAEERRRSIIAMDRKRRLTNTNYEEGRTRTNSGSYHDRRTHQDGRRGDGASSQSRGHVASDPAGLSPEVVDLTSSSPEPPTTPQRSSLSRRTSSHSSRRYVVPPWQPDSEVSECPICKRPFTWMFRRHHCRKCGRVVCNDCSPHRITIPRQFIVQPPGEDVATSPPHQPDRAFATIDLTGEDTDDDESQRLSSPPPRFVTSPYLGGGEKVRLCNPCVPDPQPNPPYYPGPGGETRAEPPSNIPGGHSRTSSQPVGSYYSGPNPRLVMPLRDEASHQRVGQSSSLGRDGSGMLGNHLGWLTSHRGTSTAPPPVPSRDSLPPLQVRPGSGILRPPYMQPHQSHEGFTSASNPGSPGHYAARRLSHEPRNERFPRVLQNFIEGPPRPRLDERDICPICRRALPPRGDNGDESARETHIMDCIRSRDPSSHTESGGGPSQARVHMLPFIATEKDCVGEDGTPSECSICMVEYDVGDELARLECLCKFHKSCIVEWLGRKAECPVHKLIA